MDAASTALPVTYATFRYEALGRRAPAASAAASAPTNLTAAPLSQVATAASSQALVEESRPTDVGSQSGFLAQIIIVVGVIPLELIIVIIMLGANRFVHRRSTRTLRIRVDSAHSAQDSLPYLQPKAELEDEQNRRHELDGEYLVQEMDDEGEILQIADETDSLDLPLQGSQGISEMPEEHHVSWKMSSGKEQGR